MNDRTVRIQCDCGADLRTESTEARLSCDCGRMYAVTVTQIAQGKTAPTIRSTDEF